MLIETWFFSFFVQKTWNWKNWKKKEKVRNLLQNLAKKCFFELAPERCTYIITCLKCNIHSDHKYTVAGIYLSICNILPALDIGDGCLQEITRGSVMCHYLTTNELIYDWMNTLYNSSSQKPTVPVFEHQIGLLQWVRWDFSSSIMCSWCL